MRPRSHRRPSGVPVILLTALLSLPAPAAAGEPRLPWRAAGWTERQAAALLLDRLAYGARPGQIDRLVATGLEAWVGDQLRGDRPEPVLAERFEHFRYLDVPVREFPEIFPRPAAVFAEARALGVVQVEDPAALTEGEKEVLRERIYDWALDQGYRPVPELVGELMAQKLVRALEAENQLVEVLTDFWFNHFNIALADIEARTYALAYERDAIRPHVMGPFRDLLGATAKHPAMLHYLDNARSTAGDADPTTLDRRMAARHKGKALPGWDASSRPERPERLRGLNENYARELLELHTLGVDGGYDQSDVIEVARAFTGWTVYPAYEARERYAERLESVGARDLGFVVDGGFLFRADAHDAGPKVVLGKRLPAGRGIEDGEEVLDLLALHPSTAHHLCRKLAARFVSDDPPSGLVDRLAKVYLRGGGDLGAVTLTLIESPEFWSPGTRGRKIKSPFELAVSAMRGLEARVTGPRDAIEWIERMGQPLYGYRAPTGYPDRADFWVSSGALLHRMNFALALATGRVEGVRFDLEALAGGREPESREAALAAYLPLLLPERKIDETLARLLPLVEAPGLVEWVEESASAPEEVKDDGLEILFAPPGRSPAPAALDGPTPVELVVGVILGSPEFQRR